MRDLQPVRRRGRSRRPPAGRGPRLRRARSDDAKISCSPRQIPSTGTPASTRSAMSSSSPRSRIALHRLRKGADAGQDHPVGRPGAFVVVRDLRADAHVLQRLLDRAQVAHPVIAESRRGSSQSALRRRHAALVRVDRHGLAQRPRERLEARLDHVVRVRSVTGPDVQRDAGVGGDRAEELLGELGVEACDRDRAADRPRTGRAAGPRCRSRTCRATRPSGRRRSRSGGSRRGRPAPRRAPVRARCRRPRPCDGRRSRGRRWPRPSGRAGRGGRAGRACGRGSRPRSSPRRLRRRGRVPGVTCVSPVLRSIFAVLGHRFQSTCNQPVFLFARARADSPCTGSPSAFAISSTAGASALAAASPSGDDRRPPHERARAQRAREARGAARRQHVVRPGGVVAERRGARRRPRRRSRRPASARCPRRRLRSAARGARARARRRARGPPRARARRPARAARPRRSGARAPRRAPAPRSRPARPASGEIATSGLSEPCSAWASRFERHRHGVGRVIQDHRQLARSREAVDADCRRRAGASPR